MADRRARAPGGFAGREHVGGFADGSNAGGLASGDDSKVAGDSSGLAAEEAARRKKFAAVKNAAGITMLRPDENGNYDFLQTEKDMALWTGLHYS